MDDETVKDMIEKAGYVDGLRPQWRESVDVIQRIVNLHNQIKILHHDANVAVVYFLRMLRMNVYQSPNVSYLIYFAS